MPFFRGRALALTLGILGLLPSLISCEDDQTATCVPRIQNSTIHKGYSPAGDTDKPQVKAGDVNCRYPAVTGPNPDSDTCAELSDHYQITLDKFFTLNPSIDRDCGNIAACTEYCVAGWVQPLVSTDGFCGPRHNNATCRLTDKPCCNSQTWQCGDQRTDCAWDVCWEGRCLLRQIDTTDGRCGIYNKKIMVQCAGEWGSCCNLENVCGTGADYCGEGVCQSGNCASPDMPLRYSPPPLDMPSLDSLNSSLSYSSSMTVPASTNSVSTAPPSFGTSESSVTATSTLPNPSPTNNAATPLRATAADPNLCWSILGILILVRHLFS